MQHWIQYEIHKRLSQIDSLQSAATWGIFFILKHSNKLNHCPQLWGGTCDLEEINDLSEGTCRAWQTGVCCFWGCLLSDLSTRAGSCIKCPTRGRPWLKFIPAWEPGGKGGDENGSGQQALTSPAQGGSRPISVHTFPLSWLSWFCSTLAFPVLIPSLLGRSPGNLLLPCESSPPGN